MHNESFPTLHKIQHNHVQEQISVVTRQSHQPCFKVIVQKLWSPFKLCGWDRCSEGLKTSLSALQSIALWYQVDSSVPLLNKYLKRGNKNQILRMMVWRKAFQWSLLTMSLLWQKYESVNIKRLKKKKKKRMKVEGSASIL